MTLEEPLPDGFRLCELDRVDSTNDEVRHRAAAGAEPGLVVLARRQTRGRGRHGRAWASPAGNLYASLLLQVDGPLATSAQLSFVAGLALAEARERHAPAGVLPRLKWPNDVLLGRAKVAGILLESAGVGSTGTADVIVGTGVNIVSCPRDTPYPATSLLEQGFAPIAPRALLGTYLAALDRWLRRWREAGFGAVREAWCARGLGLGEQIRLRLAREELHGRFVDVTA
ncbi:MAG TPA: biotin--[acetyl-CoA-carboxylase] ligase, partial [Geminicoccaceae bacterium]|nr:biotin--[acetyl-CoA-carboxylase] ligase [Geminicoccaceae bacterium]